MSHAKIAELLPWYVNGTLGMGERQSAALEVASCDECAAEVEDLAKVQTALLELEATAPEPNPHGIDRALDAIEREEERKRLGHPWLGWWWTLTPLRRALVVSAALGAIVLLGVFVTPKPAGVGQAGAAGDAYANVALERIVPDSKAVSAIPPSSAASRSAGPALAAKAAGGAASQPSLENTGEVARTAAMSLIVPDVENAITRISATARSHGGVVLALDDETPTEAGARHTAHVEIGVPDLRFEPTLDALDRIGGVQSRSVGAQDVSTQIVDGQARLRNLRSTEQDLLRIMARAGSIGDVLSVESQVSATREQIETLDAQVEALKHRVAMSTVSLDVQDEASAAPASIGFAAQLASTWVAALGSVRAFTLALLGGLLWLLAYGPYVLGVALVGGIVAVARNRG